MWTIGMSVFMKGSGQEEKAGKHSLFRKVMTNPCIVAVYTGAILMGSGISLPTFLENTISGISSCNTPLSMMLVGMMLAEGTFDQVRCILHICPVDCCARDCVWIDGTASDRSASSGNHSDHCGDADTDYSSTFVRKTWRR